MKTLLILFSTIILRINSEQLKVSVGLWSCRETYEAPEEVDHGVLVGAAAGGGLLRRGGQVAPEGALRRHHSSGQLQVTSNPHSSNRKLLGSELIKICSLNPLKTIISRGGGTCPTLCHEPEDKNNLFPSRV